MKLFRTQLAMLVCGNEVFVRDLKGLSVYRWATATK